MAGNGTLDHQLRRCEDFFVTYYWNSPAVGAHLYIVITFIVIGLIVFILGTTANIFVVIVYVNNARLKTRANLLFVALACSDLLMTAFLQPLFIIGAIHEINGGHSCVLSTLTRLVSYFCYGVSLLTVTLISIERWLTLAFPYKHHDILTTTRVRVILVSMWVSLLVFDVSHLGLTPYNVSLLISSGVSLTCFLIMLSVWLWIYRLLRRHLHRIGTLGNNNNNTSPSTTPIPPLASAHLNKMTMHTNTTCLLVTGHLLCYLPIIAFPFYFATQPTSFKGIFLVAPWADAIMLLHSSLNPLYVLSRKYEFRKAAKSMLAQLKCSDRGVGH